VYAVKQVESSGVYNTEEMNKGLKCWFLLFFLVFFKLGAIVSSSVRSPSPQIVCNLYNEKEETVSTEWFNA
jgi:hypothetical protein